MVKKIEQVLKFASVYKKAQEFDDTDETYSPDDKDELYSLKENLIKDLSRLKNNNNISNYSHQLIELISKYERESTKENKSYIIERADLLLTLMKETNMIHKEELNTIDEFISLLVKF